MRALYIPTALLLVILALSLWVGHYTHTQTQQWVALLEEAGNLAQQEHWHAAKDILDRAHRNWDRSRTFYHTIIQHDALDEAEFFFTGAAAACSEEDAAEFQILLAQLITELQLLAETQQLSVQNIL